MHIVTHQTSSMINEHAVAFITVLHNLEHSVQSLVTLVYCLWSPWSPWSPWCSAWSSWCAAHIVIGAFSELMPSAQTYNIDFWLFYINILTSNDK